MNNKLILVNLVIIILAQSFLTINCIIVQTKSGPVNGLSVTLNNKVINKFLGIPYAEPPIGSNRFGKTKAVNPWNSTYDATHFKNSCFQGSSKYKMSEDCLFLNVYSEERKNGDNTLRPVMFWIHGGGLGAGDGYSFNGFDGTVLASEGVVVVSINYRLGPFGFLYGGDSSAPGNVGILDQIMGLHWVKDNIELFGGNPNEITIFGLSAGSWSVSILIVSPLAKNLFKRAIMISGGYYFKNFINSDKATHLAHSKIMSESLGCGHGNEWLTCMRNVSAEDIIKHNKVESALTYGDDAGVVPFGIEEALMQKKVNPGIELIAGTTGMEGVNWAVNNLPKLSNMSIHITKDELKVKILSLFDKNPKIGQSVYDFYISHIDESNQKVLRQRFTDIFSDRIILCPTYYFAKEYVKASASDKTFFYVSTYKSRHSGCNQDWMGVCHVDDMPFMMGTPVVQRSSFNETDYKYSLMVSQMLTDFAKTGNPLSHSVTNLMGTVVKSWPAFIETKTSSLTPKVMELNPMKFGNVLVDPYHENCDKVMKPYYD